MNQHKRPSFEDMIRWVDSRLRHVESEMEKDEEEELVSEDE